MLAIQTLNLVAFVSAVSAFNLPVTMAPSATGTQLHSRQFNPGQFFPGQLSAGEHSAGQFSAGTSQASAGCGLETNVWGQVSATTTSGFANLCLQCRVNFFGVDIVQFNFFNALAASISAHGVSASQLSVLQGAIEGDLLKLSAGAKTSASCTAACAGDQRCDSCSFVNGSCRIKAVNYLTQNHAGAPLAQAFQGLYSNGGSGYCSICPADRSCSGPKPSALPRRSLAKNSLIDEKCPAGLSACPILSGVPLNPSSGFECLDVQQEASSCGGCASTGQGVDCTAIKGVSSSGCSDGTCKIYSCKAGYHYSPIHSICYKSHRSSKMALSAR
ncbi:hypothetical protein PtB15_12B43 [Puccinia triticina]|nr:hypothetical protein PtB15_12B43 [Puccinia triticina]